MTDVLRLLTDEPEDGPTNMGRDQALLARVGAGSSPPTLRLYAWSPATISLGRFQPYRAYEALAAQAGALPVVRRVTGGGAILHDAELTYSLTLPCDHRLARGNPACLYDPVHEAVIGAVGDLGVTAERCNADDAPTARRDAPFFCFARRHPTDVIVGSAKLAGSAQRRSRDAVLQHGSIILANRQKVQPSAVLGAGASAGRLAELFTQHLARCLRVRFEPGTWSDAERVDATREALRFGDPAWTRKR